MSRLRAWIARQPQRVRWASLAALVLVVALAAWFFFIRPAGISVNPAAAPTPPSRPALGKVVSFEQYAAAIEHALSDVRVAKALSGSERTKKALSAATTLEGVEGASVAIGNAPAQIDNTEAIAALRESELYLEAIESSLNALNASLQATVSAQSLAGTKSGAHAAADLSSVLSDPIFNYEHDLSPLQKLARWLAQFSNNADPNDVAWRWVTALMTGVAVGILTWLGTGRIANRWGRLGVAAAAGLVAGIAFYVAVENLDVAVEVLTAVGFAVAALAATLITVGLNAASSPPAPRRISELAAVLGMSAGEARQRAEEAATQGDYRLATRFRCLAVLLALDEAGKLVFDRAATNREYLFRAQGPLHDDLQPLLDGFDAVWYGEKPTSEAEYAQYAQRATAIEAQLAAEPRTQPVGRPQGSPA